MYKFIQKNQKKFLAVFGVLLMIVFILPQAVKNNLTQGEATIGTIDGEKITGNDLRQAKNDLDLLSQHGFPPLFELGGPRRQNDVSVFGKFLHGDDGALAYLLLQKEAEKQGFSVSPQAADAMATAAFTDMPAAEVEGLSPAVGRFMLVQAAFQRASESVKASKPLLQYYVSQLDQGSTLNLVEYNAAEIEKNIPAPTTQEVYQEYAKYGDSFPKASLTTRPSTPGYKVPDRVKLQYLELPRSAVVEWVLNQLSSKDSYSLDVEACYPYYLAHQNEFEVPPPPATRPAPEVLGSPLPSSAPSTAPTTASQPSTLPATAPVGPTTKPFPEVTLEIRKRLLTDPTASSTDQVVVLRGWVTSREKELRAALHDQLARAYVQWAATHPGDSAATQPVTSTDSTSLPQASSPSASTTQASTTQAGPTSQPQTLPTTNLVVANYPDLDFLTAFADAFEAQYKVRPLVTSLANTWLTRDDLTALPNIGSAQHGQTPFFEYALHDLTPPTPTSLPASQPSTNPAMAATTAPTTAATTAPTTAALATTAPTTSPAEPTLASLASWQPSGTGLRPFEPSDPLEDTDGNTYVFRLTAFEPAHRPPLADVEPRIVEQLTSAAAGQIAHNQAIDLLARAQLETQRRKEHKLPDLQGLPDAARAAGRTLIEAGPFQAQLLNVLGPRSISGYSPTDPGDSFTFLREIQMLAKQQTPDNLHPSTVIELPAERKALVAEMGETVRGKEIPDNDGGWHFAPLTTDGVYAADAKMVPVARVVMERGPIGGPDAASGGSLLQDWFDLNNVIARVKYIKTKRS